MLFASVMVQLFGHTFMGSRTSNTVGIITVSLAPFAFAAGWVSASALTACMPLLRRPGPAAPDPPPLPPQCTA